VREPKRSRLHAAELDETAASQPADDNFWHVTAAVGPSDNPGSPDAKLAVRMVPATREVRTFLPFCLTPDTGGAI